MALSTATITGDIADHIGNDFDIRRTKIWITTNVPGQTIIDTTGDKIRLGSGNVTLGADGTFTAVVWVPGAGSNPASWQTTIHVDYPDRNATNGRAVKAFGPFTITANANLADLVAEMPVQPEYLATVLATVQDMIDEATDGTGPALGALADRLDGVDDHGNLAGTVTLDPAKGFHIFDATGPLEVSLGNPPGYSLAFKAITGATNVTVDGLPDLELTDDAWATFVHYRSSWHLAASGASGGGDVEPVTDPPTQPGAVTVDPTADGYNLSWVASTVAAGYEVQIDGGTWVDSGAGTTHVHTGLTAGSSHSGAVRAYNTLGAKSTSRAWGPASTDTVGLHEQLLAYDAPLYMNFTNGSVQDFSSVERTWDYDAFAAFGGTVPATFNGPVIAGQGTGSALLHSQNAWRSTTRDGIIPFENQPVVTFIQLIKGYVPRVHFLDTVLATRGSVGNELLSDDLTIDHLLVWTWEEGVGGKVYRDGVLTGSAFTWKNGLDRTDSDGKGIWFGASNRHFDLPSTDDRSSALLFGAPILLTSSEIVALAQAAGTYGNPR